MTGLPPLAPGDVPAVWAPLLTAVTSVWAVLVLRLRRRGRWQVSRVALGGSGLLLLWTGLVGTVPARALADMQWHMVQHLVLASAAPLAVALSAPVSLVLRSMPVGGARRLVRLLAHPALRWPTHVVPAALLGAGGLWVLYLTPLLELSHRRGWVAGLVQAHLFVAGYLFTAAAIGRDPLLHRAGRWTTMVVLVITAAAHSVLARRIYATPPPGFDPDEVRGAAELMYYGGAALELCLFAVFCGQWYRAARPREVIGGSTTPAPSSHGVATGSAGTEPAAARPTPPPHPRRGRPVTPRGASTAACRR